MTSFRFRDINRLAKVVGVFAKYGFDDIVAHSQLHRIIPRRRFKSIKKEGEKIVARNRYERFRMALEDLGPTYIKLGQILSNRHDLLPAPLIAELEKLQDNVAPEADMDIVRELHKRLDIDVEQEFESVDPKPEASASIAQVHRAKLKNGDHVVLKIQRTGIREMVASDIEIIRQIVRLVQKRMPEFAIYKPLDLLASFERSIRLEMNFSAEANNIQRFRANFTEDDRIYVPKVYSRYSNETILCMEEVLGTKISDVEELKKKELDINRIVEAGVDLYFKQIFKFGYFHADPHPGNLVIMNDEKICFLDFGMMGSLLPKDRDTIGNAVVNFLRKDIRRLILNIEDLTGESIIDEKKSIQYDLYDMMHEIGSLPIKDINMEMLYEKIHAFIYNHKISIPADMFLLMRTLVVLEGMGLKLKPDFNLIEALKPYAKKLVINKYNPKNLAESVWDTFLDVSDLMKGVPEDTKKILQNVKEGKLKIAFVHQGLEGFYQSMDRDTNRLSLAIITAALIVGSSLVVLSRIPPLVFNIPLIGMIGFFTSFILGVLVIISIIRQNKL